MAKSHLMFFCQQCGKESPKWFGRCPDCEGWNTFVERPVDHSKRSESWLHFTQSEAIELPNVSTEQHPRLLTSSSEFNRVVGGGIVPGSLVLVGGDPGIGKSTLLLQVSAMIAAQGSKVLYISGEESMHQIKLRADRLGIEGERLYLLSETNLHTILQQMHDISPDLTIIDSIQTVYVEEVGGAPGSVGQIRESTLQLMQYAKSSTTPVFITGHVTKEGSVAGPKTLEHIVDVVLYLEGDSFSAYRLLRAVKNRFGSTNEVGIFEMRDIGLIEVVDPSKALLSSRAHGAIGSAVASTLEGTRPLLLEIQALTTPTSFGQPRRTANGIDINRLLMLTAVLTKRVGLHLGTQDVIVSVAGGIKITEPAADLAIALAITSSLRDQEIDPDLVAVGEIGLSGEVRSVSQLERRLSEATRQGFTRCLIPKASLDKLPPQNIDILAAESLREALHRALRPKDRAVSTPAGNDR